MRTIILPLKPRIDREVDREEKQELPECQPGKHQGAMICKYVMHPAASVAYLQLLWLSGFNTNECCISNRPFPTQTKSVL